MAYTNIDDPSAHFQTATYTGNNTANHAITNDGNSDLQPDMLWIKSRDAAHSHWLVDSNRGVTKGFFVEASDAERTSLATRDVASFDTDGFTVGVPYQSSSTNSNASTKVAWQWKANGGTTSTDTTSSITSTVQVNSDAGFSIVTYTGDGTTAGGFGHGLGVAPKVVFVKRRNTAADWAVYHKDIGAANFLKLSTNDAQASGVWQGIDPSSTRVTVYQGGFVNGNGDDYVAYCFAEKQGYSKFGSYKGNGNANGPFIYTGFKPAFVIVKRTTGTGNWLVYDNKRGAFNLNDEYFYANSDAGESTSSTSGYDFLSNGFKTRNTYNDGNVSGQTYIYMAFAENPFVTSTGIPTTAR